jgi:hypothetical protein
MYAGPNPFTQYGPVNRPAQAALLCVFVAQGDHRINPGSGNCFPLPDVPTATAFENTSCLDRPVETGEIRATFRAGTSSKILGFSADKSWISIQNPERENRNVRDCWVPFESSFMGGDSSQVPVLP